MGAEAGSAVLIPAVTASKLTVVRRRVLGMEGGGVGVGGRCWPGEVTSVEAGEGERPGGRKRPHQGVRPGGVGGEVRREEVATQAEAAGGWGQCSEVVVEVGWMREGGRWKEGWMEMVWNGRNQNGRVVDKET